MKKTLFSSLLFAGVMMLFCTVAAGQDSIALKSQMLDMKLQLLDSKLELLDTKIRLWEAKPKDLDNRLTELGTKIASMNFDPAAMTRRVNEIDSLFRESEKRNLTEEREAGEVYRETAREEMPVFIPSYGSAIMLDPLRLLEGTFSLSYERSLGSRFSVIAGGMATYSTTQGISNYYFRNQAFSYFDKASNVYQPYEGEVMSGWGLNFQFRNYLLAAHPGRKSAPLGLYAAPQLMYRNLKITGYYRELQPVEEHPEQHQMVDKQIEQKLNIFAAGAVIGVKIPVLKVLAIDIFAGGNIRLSKYDNEKGFTRYKDWSNFDFSGVAPVAGITLGILK